MRTHANNSLAVAVFGFFIVFATASPCILTGCTATGPCAAMGAGCACGECEVCRKNGDLACLEVKITERTPRTMYEGKEFYFCSEDCKREFLANPTRYIRGVTTTLSHG